MYNDIHFLILNFFIISFNDIQFFIREGLKFVKATISVVEFAKLNYHFVISY